MPGTDVILSAYACSPQAPCTQWAEDFFDEKPIVLCVPGTSGAFLRKARQWAATGDAFRAALIELAPEHKDVEIRRRGIVTFSSGWHLTHHLLKNPKELERLDACILEDGLHTKDMDHWVDFAARAAKGDAWMAIAYSQMSKLAKETNEAIFLRAAEQHPLAQKRKHLPDYLANPEFIEHNGVRITVAAVKDTYGKMVLPAQTKVWEKDSLASWDSLGNLYLLRYDGDDRTDHVYINMHVAPRLWKLLADHWRPTYGVKSVIKV